jgi:hypothetical protein
MIGYLVLMWFMMEKFKFKGKKIIIIIA